MNSFGNNFRISIYGESHGPEIGITIDGMPAGLYINESELNDYVSRRKATQIGSTARKEKDIPFIASGVFNHYTTGNPINIRFNNGDVKSKDYLFVKDIPRPNTSDFVASQKYFGYNDYRGSGIFSGRLTACLMVAGYFATLLFTNIKIKASIVDENQLLDKIRELMKVGDSCGALIECRVENIPVGIGDPYFNSLESMLSHALFSIPGVKGVEFGLELDSSRALGSEYNDRLVDASGHTATNNSGGVVGGIANGNTLEFRVKIKPTASISQNQKTYSLKEKKLVNLHIAGRHDTCFALRVPPIIESVTAIVLADLMLTRKTEYR